MAQRVRSARVSVAGEEVCRMDEGLLALVGVAREDGAIGFRCSAHPAAAALARCVAREGVGPLTATSLNRSGEAPARTRSEAARHCDGGSDSPILVLSQLRSRL